MNIASLPKVELHVHLDCSLSYGVVKKLRPGTTEKEYRNNFVAPAKCSDLSDYISRAAAGIELMQTEEQLRAVTLDLFEQFDADRVIYAEFRFAPLEHTRKGLSTEEVVRSVSDAADEGVRATGIEAGIILCTLRHYTEAQSMETVRLVEQFSKGNSRVAGFDIAADEAGFPIDNHIAAFDFAREHRLNVTAHAGEALGSESVWETLNHFHPARIGHGIRSVEDASLMEHLREHDIHLEVCPTSNVQTNVFDTIADHCIDRIYRSGVSMSVNTDARAISDVTLCDEYENLRSEFGWDTYRFLRCNMEALEHAFTSKAVKDRLRERIKHEYREL